MFLSRNEISIAPKGCECNFNKGEQYLETFFISIYSSGNVTLNKNERFHILRS